MARFLKHEVVSKILGIGIVPVFYNSDLETSKKIVEACAAGGAKVVEFTNRGDFAYQVFTELAKWCGESLPEVALGVGTVIDPGTAALYINSGANFVVGPVLNAEIARVCNRRRVAYSPGCGTVSEISLAEELGVDIVKIFPGAEVGGPSFVKNLLGPCPWAKIMPTGGVDATWESISSWIKAGTAALGMGSKLVTKELVATKDFEGIQRKVEECIWWVKKARGEPLFLGVEHVGLYPTKTATAAEIADWYAGTFGFKKSEGASSFFLSGQGAGRIEVMKEPLQTSCHVAIRVSNFEEACKYLTERGVQLDEPRIKKGVKAAYLKEPDKAGNRVHLLYAED
jgi:2-dehydro-3-deoxyphosphogluconate aldolase/(4S)-4-hydroxy-2-oxoglutarate aldolase